MAPPPEEVDLTSDTPPKKMKQARLPFAPLNKSSAASNKKVGELASIDYMNEYFIKTFC